MFNRQGFESVHLRPEPIPVASNAAQQNAAEFRIRGRAIEAAAEFSEYGPRNGSADDYPLDLPKKSGDGGWTHGLWHLPLLCGDYNTNTRPVTWVVTSDTPL